MEYTHNILSLINLYLLKYGSEYLNVLDNDIAFVLNDNEILCNYVSEYLKENPHILNMLMTSCNKTHHKEWLVNLWNRISERKRKEVYDYLTNMYYNDIRTF